jgi:hypothetical protein
VDLETGIGVDMQDGWIFRLLGLVRILFADGQMPTESLIQNHSLACAGGQLVIEFDLIS